MNKIVRKEQFSEKVFLFEMEAPLIAKSRKAGNFVIVRVDQRGERMPLTIAGADIEKGTITLVVQMVGLSSKKLCALNEGDYEKVGELMYKTHEGLSKDYEVSCEELDFLNDIAKENGVTGSRIMGGGFGGCTINLVRNDLYKKFIEDAKKKFNEKYGHEPKVYDVVISDGSRKLC